uniref:Ig-like domain-containing protein n=1 Tax=Gopherus evgoodei TaxID=1825980 RepID=A0A8C4Y9C3_9SAUR
LCWLIPLPAKHWHFRGFRVHQPPEVRASPGGSVLLNCSFFATPKASKLAVTWVQSTPGGSGEVQIYQPPSQVTELRNRVALDSGRFRHQRDVSLHLVNLTQHDARLYRCRGGDGGKGDGQGEEGDGEKEEGQGEEGDGGLGEGQAEEGVEGKGKGRQRRGMEKRRKGREE